MKKPECSSVVRLNVAFGDSKVSKDEEACFTSPHRLCSHSFQLCGWSFPMNHLRLERTAGLAAVRDTDGIIPLGVGTNRIPGSPGEHLVLMSWEGEVIPFAFFFPFFPFSQATVSCTLAHMDPLSTFNSNHIFHVCG